MCIRDRVVDTAELLRAHAHGQGEQNVGLRAADAVGDQNGVVAVAAVLAQQGRRVPELRDRLLGDVECPEPGVQHPAVGRRADGGPGGELGDPRQGGGAGPLPEHLSQCGGAALLPYRNRFFGGDLAPDPRDVPGHLAGCEVVEDRVDHGGRRHPQRRGPAREVAVPVVAHADGEERLVRHVGEGDGADRLDELEHAVDLDLCVRHRPALLSSRWRPGWRPLIKATNAAARNRQLAGYLVKLDV